MYEWLEEEIASIRTAGFHDVDGPADEGLADAIMSSGIPVPVSYVDFVLKFGNAKLYRDLKGNAYAIGIFAAPRRSTLPNGTVIYFIGHHDDAKVYVKEDVTLSAFPIYEVQGASETWVANDFETWLRRSCEEARRNFTEEEWNEIKLGPRPFSTSEEEVVKARRNMKWKVLGIDADGRHIIEITNTGSMQLPMLKIGARSRDGSLNGGVILKTDGLGAGETRVLRIACYRGLVPPEEIDLFSLPDPRPEDRSRYPEFRNTLHRE